jgi:hypothetical protein
VNDRRYVGLAKHDRRRHQKLPARGAVFAARRALGVIEIFDQLARRGDEGVASLG